MALMDPTKAPTTGDCGHVGIIKPQEAKEHWHKLDETIENLKKDANEEEIQEIMKDFIEVTKTACMEVHTPMAGADVSKVLHSMGDPYGLAIRQQTEEVERRLKVMMPEEELIEGKELACMVDTVEPITAETKETLINLMGHMVDGILSGCTIGRVVHNSGLNLHT